MIVCMKKGLTLIKPIFTDGGVGETRTLAPVTRSTSLAGKPLHQLGYYSSERSLS